MGRTLKFTFIKLLQNYLGVRNAFFYLIVLQFKILCIISISGNKQIPF